MTQAVCFKCGEMKHGAFTDCPHCGGRPVTDDELVLSLAMTDHYFDLATMKQMGAQAQSSRLMMEMTLCLRLNRLSTQTSH